MPPLKDLTGQTKSRLTALRCVGRTKHGQAIWLFRCACSGREVEVTSRGFVSGTTQSCGCLSREQSATRLRVTGAAHPSFKHGHASRVGLTRTYRSWKMMRQRCTNPNFTEWMHYGAIGIRVCERWLNSFEAFLEDMGERPEGTTLGRYGDVGNYEPGNCEWQTPKQQGAEQKIKRARIAHQQEDRVLEEIFGRQAA